MTIIVGDCLAHCGLSHANAYCQRVASALGSLARTVLISPYGVAETLPGTEGLEKLPLSSKPTSASQRTPKPWDVLILSLRLTLGIWRHAARLQPDIVYLTDTRGIAAWLLQFLLPGTTVFLNIHEGGPDRIDPSWWQFRVFWFFELRALRWLGNRSRIFVLGPVERQKLQENHGVRIPENHVVTYGIEETRPSVTRPFRSSVLIFGAINARKNYPCAIRGFLGQDVFKKLVLAGDLEQPEIADLIRELDHDKRIVLLNRYISETELPRLFEESDIFLQPRGAGYGFVSGSTAVALAHGVPLVGARAGLVGTLIEKYDLGLCHTPDDSDSLSAALAVVGEDYAACYARFRAGHARLIADWGWSAVARKTLDQMQNVIESRRPKRGDSPK